MSRKKQSHRNSRNRLGRNSRSARQAGLPELVGTLVVPVTIVLIMTFGVVRRAMRHYSRHGHIHVPFADVMLVTVFTLVIFLVLFFWFFPRK